MNIDLFIHFLAFSYMQISIHYSFISSNSLPHDGGRWPSQNTSLTFSDLAHSLTIAEDELQPLNQVSTTVLFHVIYQKVLSVENCYNILYKAHGLS